MYTITCNINNNSYVPRSSIGFRCDFVKETVARSVGRGRFRKLGAAGSRPAKAAKGMAVTIECMLVTPK